MPKAPVPPQADEFLRLANPAVVATIMPNGQPHTAATWYIWDHGRFALNMASTRRRLGYLRANPNVSLTVLGADNWGRQLTLIGHVASLERDPDLTETDRVASHYTGQPWSARDQERWVAWVDVDRWFGWEGGSPWPPQ